MSFKEIPTFLILFLLLICAPVRGQKAIELVSGSTQKIEQLIGDWDKENEIPTQNRTLERYQLPSTDLGVPFNHKGKTYICFGDVWMENGDPLGYTNDTDPEDGITIDFVSNPAGSYKEISIPGVSLGGFEVPMEGVSWNGNMYLYCTTDVMTRSILAKSGDDGQTFTKLYDVSESKFINLNLVKGISDNHYPLPAGTEIQVMFGSGEYRNSSVYLAFQRGDQIEQRSIYFFSGLNNSGEPAWTLDESEALPLFDQPCVGELSVSYNEFVQQWILTYNCEEPRGVNCRVSDNPWGPWSDPFVIFDPWDDNGYCHFIHASWDYYNCDQVHDSGREYEWGGEYGPYQFDQLATGTDGETTIYYSLSTWNPYTVVLMKSTLMDKNTSKRSIELQHLKNIEVYPIPCADYVIVSCKGEDPGISGIKVSTVNGTILLTEDNLTEGKHSYTLNTSSLSPGLYFLQIESDSGEHIYSIKISVAR
jgi:hypothetical protein